jgi:hypothetical protein
MVKRSLWRTFVRGIPGYICAPVDRIVDRDEQAGHQWRPRLANRARDLIDRVPTPERGFCAMHTAKPPRLRLIKSLRHGEIDIKMS